MWGSQKEKASHVFQLKFEVSREVEASQSEKCPRKPEYKKSQVLPAHSHSVQKRILGI